MKQCLHGRARERQARPLHLRSILPFEKDLLQFWGGSLSGGGTPSLLEPGLISRLFAALRAEFAVDADAEITVECAPGQLKDDTLEALVAVGVSRVSLGVQSFIDREAQACGRLHSRAIVLDDLRRLR